MIWRPIPATHNFGEMLIYRSSLNHDVETYNLDMVVAFRFFEFRLCEDTAIAVALSLQVEAFRYVDYIHCPGMCPA